MKVAILAGGHGTRLAEETVVRPKPMVEIGGIPILCHIMEHYTEHGHSEFFVALGYKGEYIKRYFADAALLGSDITVDFTNRSVEPHHPVVRDDWRIHLIETGKDTQTGGRIKRLEPHLGGDTFMLTWGDGVSNVDLDALLEFHREHGKLLTMTVVRPPARYGHVEIAADGRVEVFDEKPQTGEGWINGAFFVCEPEVFSYIEGDATVWEREPLEQIAKDGQLMAYRHYDFWQCMDTMRDKHLLEEMWDSGEAPWTMPNG